MKNGIVKSGIFELEYIIEGRGQSTILVIGSAKYYSRIFSEQIKSKYQFVFIDHRGFAKSIGAYTKSDFELNTILDDIELVRTHLNLGKIVILGHSGHGFMALEYVKKYPDNTSKVILIGMGPNTSESNKKISDEYFENNASQERKAAQEMSLKNLESAIDSDPERRFITYCIKLGPRSWYDYNYDATELWQDINVNMIAFDYLWGEVFANIEITNGLDDLDMPVLLLLGKHDYLVAPYYTWDPIIDKYKNFTIKIFDKAGHTPQLECSEQFDNELIKFIEDK
jgi:proline iminopeptidase